MNTDVDGVFPDDADAHIARQAQQAGAEYKITASDSGNQVDMTATLSK